MPFVEVMSQDGMAPMVVLSHGNLFDDGPRTRSMAELGLKRIGENDGK